MTGTILGIVGSVITLILGPLLAFWIKNWWEKKAAEAAAAQRQAEEEKKSQQDSQSQAQQTGSINDSIDKQREAAGAWAQEQQKKK